MIIIVRWPIIVSPRIPPADGFPVGERLPPWDHRRAAMAPTGASQMVAFLDPRPFVPGTVGPGPFAPFLRRTPRGSAGCPPRRLDPPAFQGGRGPLLSRGSCPRRYCSVECLCSRPRARPAVVIVPAQRGAPILLSLDSSPSSVPAPTPPCPRRFERRDGGSNPNILISSSVIDRTSKN